MVDNYKEWHNKLRFALLRYRTTVCTSTGATPYLLVYGTELVIPRSGNPFLKNHTRSRAQLCGMAKDFNKKVRSRQFSPGQLVLKGIFPRQNKAKGKFSPNWQGPYMVHRVITGGTLILAEIDGESWPKPINSDDYV
ncbi:PREDICTED: uncharacterized protein LOC109241599 [Nicotiana attenuata]|uniref:uncharacterized protein LOC109241599 n=1 Tax=Nicotiana attenuata TaxID=49451 RepID=UPI000904A404|nr:PREDICTED: uncharacterized protein LOC109241599 [Nicotiana attenuata]